MPERKRPNRTRRLLAVDAVITLLFVAVMDVPLTGVAWHEWLGIALAVGSAVHLLQHTEWIVSTARKLRSTSLLNRANAAMTVLLLAGYATIAGSGLVISEAALPALGVTTDPTGFWVWLHLASVGFTLWLTAAHVALNWTWIRTTVGRLVVRPVRSRLGWGATEVAR